MDNEGFKFLREAFEKVAAKFDQSDLAARAVRSLAAGGKAAVDRGLQEFPKPLVSDFAKEIYGVLTSQEFADGLSKTVRGVDEEQVRELVGKFFAPLKDPEKALILVQSMKQLKTNPEETIAQLEEQIKNRSPLEQFILGALIEEAKKRSGEIKGLSFDEMVDQVEGLLTSLPGPAGQMVSSVFPVIKPIISSFQYASDEQIAQGLVDIVDMLKLDDVLVDLVVSKTQNYTPEQVSKQASALVGKLPAPQSVGDLVHNVGEEVSKKLGLVSQSKTLSEANDNLRDLTTSVKDIVAETFRKDADSKSNFDKKKKKKFDF